MKKLIPLLVLAGVGALVVACGKKAEEVAPETAVADPTPVPDAYSAPPAETVRPAEPSTVPEAGAAAGEPGDTMGPTPTTPPPTNTQATPPQ